MSTVLRPDKGVYNSPKPVQLECVFDAKHSDSLAARGGNNTNYQGGNGKWTANATLVAGAMDYAQNGVAWSVAHGGGPSTATVSLTTGNSDAFLDMTKDFIIKNTFYSSSSVPLGTNLTLRPRIKIIMDANPTFSLQYRIDISLSTGTARWLFGYIDPGGASYSTYGSITGKALDSVFVENFKCELALAWSKRVQDNTDAGIDLYLNGYYLTTINSAINTIDNLGTQCNAELSVNYSGGPGTPASTQSGRMRNFMVVPYILYGNGTTHDYDNGISRETTVKVLQSSIFAASFGGWPIVVPLTTPYFMSFLLAERGRSGIQPLAAVMPVTNTVEELNFEYVLQNRTHNNPLAPKTPWVMIDGSVALGESYLADGAVYDASGDEYDVQPTYDIEENPIAEFRTAQLFSVLNNGEWEGMKDGSGDSGKTNSDVELGFIPCKKRKEKSSKMMNEESYAGFVMSNSGLGSDTDGNGGWPISCDRSPSSPMEFYGDGVAPTIVMESALRYFRFAELPNKNTDRYKSLFVAWKENAVPSGAVTELWDMDVVLGRIYNNDKVDVSAAFGATGYRTLAAGNTPAVIRDLPQELGATAPAFRLPPDLAIVPLGEPGVTEDHRVYVTVPNTLALGDYGFRLYYYDITDNGETTVTSGSVVFDDVIYNQDDLTIIYDSVLQFDIIQPHEGVFIMVAVMGDSSWNQGDFIEDRIVMVTFDSTDGIHFRNPQFVVLDGLMWYPAATHLYTYAYPSLSYTNRGQYAGEVLLGATQVNKVSESEKYKSAIFKSQYNVRDWSSTYARPWTMIVPCNELVQERDYDDYKSLVLGAAAFRDRLGKLHVAINKISYGYSVEELFVDDFYGGMYYVVLDRANRSNEFGVVNQSADEALGQFDIVSMNRFMQHNRAIRATDATAALYTTSCLLRPHFSICGMDGYFTFNAQFLDTYITTYTDKGRDVVYRLFQPTDLGELFPPGPAWNYASGAPVEGAVALANNYNIWRKENWADTFPTLKAAGLQWTGLTTMRSAYQWYQDRAAADAYYDARFPNTTVAVKTRFRHEGTHTGAPIDMLNKLTFAITFRYFLWGADLTTLGNYTYLDRLHFFFNEDTVEVYYGNAGFLTLVWSKTGLDFTVFRDIYIVGYNDPSEDDSYWNIYMERVPDGAVDTSERWMPKTFILLNDEPIVLSSNTSAAGILHDNQIDFGGYMSGAVAASGDNAMTVKYFQVYPSMFKIPGNYVLKDSLGAKVDPGTKGTSCLVGGPTAALVQRHYAYGEDQNSINLCPAVFQAETGTKTGLLGDAYRTYSGNADMSALSNRNAPGEIDVGNNVSIIIGDPTAIEAAPTQEILYKYTFFNGIGRAFDSRPSTFWGCSQESATVRIAFDSQGFKTPLSKLSANAIWLLNTNLINVRIKADNAAAAWGAPAFEEYISFIVDSGVAGTVYGVAGTDDLVVEDLTKNWVPNQFVNEDFPYHIIDKSTALTFYGGKIVKNTSTKIWYRLSERMSGVSYSAIAAGAEFSIVAPSIFYEFTGGVQEYRYWALEILPGGGADYQYFCNGLGKVAEIGLGMAIDLGEYGSPGYSQKLKNMLSKNMLESGRSLSLIQPGKLCNEFELQMTNIEPNLKHKLIDLFRVCEESNIPLWFLPTTIDKNSLYLCDFSDSKLSIDTVLDNFLDANGSGVDHESRVTMTATLKQRI